MIGPSSFSAYEDSFEQREGELALLNEDKTSRPRQKGSYSKNRLTRVYEEFGPLSEEFYYEVKNFLAYLQHRYLGYYDEDVQIDCYEKVVRSFSEYDPTKSNIATWIHTIVRYHISNVRYSMNKRTFREGSSLNDSMPGGVFDHEGIGERDRVLSCVGNFCKISIQSQDSDFLNSISVVREHPISIRALWEEERCSNPTLKKPVINMKWNCPERL